jgi:hypothetical protein
VYKIRSRFHRSFFFLDYLGFLLPSRSFLVNSVPLLVLLLFFYLLQSSLLFSSYSVSRLTPSPFSGRPLLAFFSSLGFLVRSLTSQHVLSTAVQHLLGEVRFSVYIGLIYVIHPFFRFPSIALGFFLAPLLPWWNDSLFSYSLFLLLHRLHGFLIRFTSYAFSPHLLCLLLSFLSCLSLEISAFHPFPLSLLSFPFYTYSTTRPLHPVLLLYACYTRFTAAAGTCFCHNLPSFPPFTSFSVYSTFHYWVILPCILPNFPHC